MVARSGSGRKQKKTHSAPKYCQFKPLLLSSGMVPWVFCSSVTRKNTRDVTLPIAQIPRQRKETIVAALLVLTVTWRKTIFHFQPSKTRDYLIHRSIYILHPAPVCLFTLSVQPTPDGSNLQAGEGTYITCMTIQSSGRSYFPLQLIYR